MIAYKKKMMLVLKEKCLNTVSGKKYKNILYIRNQYLTCINKCHQMESILTT